MTLTLISRNRRILTRCICNRGINTKAKDTEQSRSLEIHHEPDTGTSLTADVFSGAPVELHNRTVRIFKPSKTAMQSGVRATREWELNFDTHGKYARWEHPLMGWAASADYMQGTRLKFNTKEDAIHFAEKQGWDYFIQEPQERKIKPKSYSNNFVYSPGPLKVIHTK